MQRVRLEPAHLQWAAGPGRRGAAAAAAAPRHRQKQEFVKAHGAAAVRVHLRDRAPHILVGDLVWKPVQAINRPGSVPYRAENVSALWKSCFKHLLTGGLERLENLIRTQFSAPVPVQANEQGAKTGNRLGF